MNKKLMFLSAAALSLILSGCGDSDGETGSESSNQKVAYVTAGAMGDDGFTDSTVSGLEALEEEYGVNTTVIENNNDSARFSQSIEAATQWNPDVIYADAYGFEELYIDFAENNPDTYVINLDFILENPSNTISSVTFINEEGAFLAGALAALVTESDLELANEEKVVGFVGGQDIPVIRSFQYGFEQGVKHVNPDIRVVSNYVGDFFDPTLGKQAANQLYAQGVDIIFQAAGASGAGALEAASESNKYIIGVDSNQNGIYPGFVVSSVIKDLGGAVQEIYKEIDEGTYEPGTHYEKGIGVGGLMLALDEYSEDILTEEILNEIKSIEEAVINGDVTIERYNN